MFGMGQREGADLRVQRKAMHPRPQRDDHHRCRPVDREAGGDLRRARLQEILDRGRSTPSGQRNTEKIVPTGMLTSILDEPSSGSNSSR
jgi:hypothetical protein